jgi:broad specificity phosphatase PhoE
VTTLLLVRHGETDWNAEGRLQGHTDRPLSDLGRRQARQLAGELASEELDAIYSSDLARARETAEIVGERLGLPVVLDPDLREKDWGTWEGLTSVERDRVEFVGESTEAHQERILHALRRIAGRHRRWRKAVRQIPVPSAIRRGRQDAARQRCRPPPLTTQA